MPKIQSILLIIGFLVGLTTPVMAQSVEEKPETPSATEEKTEPIKPATTTTGPEGSEITPDEELTRKKKVGIGFTFGQTLLSGDETSHESGFNNTVGKGIFLSYSYRERLDLLVKYWTSQHDGIEDANGDLRRSHFTGELNFYFNQGIFSPYGIAGAGIYFSEFDPSPVQKQAGIGSSSVNTFGLLIGVGIAFEASKNFLLELSAIRHHSFKRRNSERGVDEALPFDTIGLTGKTYF